MKLGACTRDGHTRRLASTDDDCAQPAVTRIAKARIAKSAGRATFTSAAPHARTYVCELLSHGRVVGMSRAGIARKATVYGFRIG